MRFKIKTYDRHTICGELGHLTREVFEDGVDDHGFQKFRTGRINDAEFMIDDNVSQIVWLALLHAFTYRLPVALESEQHGAKFTARAIVVSLSYAHARLRLIETR
jgi:hypothetical protein